MTGVSAKTNICLVRCLPDSSLHILKPWQFKGVGVFFCEKHGTHFSASWKSLMKFISGFYIGLQLYDTGKARIWAKRLFEIKVWSWYFLCCKCLILSSSTSFPCLPFVAWFFCIISEKNTCFSFFTWSLFLTMPASLSHQLTICITQYTKGHNSFQSWFKAILK